MTWMKNCLLYWWNRNVTLSVSDLTKLLFPPDKYKQKAVLLTWNQYDTNIDLIYCVFWEKDFTIRSVVFKRNIGLPPCVKPYQTYTTTIKLVSYPLQLKDITLYFCNISQHKQFLSPGEVHMTISNEYQLQHNCDYNIGNNYAYQCKKVWGFSIIKHAYMFRLKLTF